MGANPAPPGYGWYWRDADGVAGLNMLHQVQLPPGGGQAPMI